jgi:hypothetical protein
MAADSWVPHKFRYLSTRLVTKNGIIMMGLAALLVLYGTKGETTLLVVLYSISVFLTFRAVAVRAVPVLVASSRRAPLVRPADALARRLDDLRGDPRDADLQQLHQGLAGRPCSSSAASSPVCTYIRHHYDDTKAQLLKIDAIFAAQPLGPQDSEPPLSEGRADGGVPGGLEQGRRHPHALVGAADVSGALQELRVHQRPHRRRPQLRRRGGARST